MTPTERALRADAERNRRRVLDAAEELFRDRGLDVGVAEIAQHAGVESAIPEQLLSRVEQPPAIPFGVGSQRAVGGRHALGLSYAATADGASSSTLRFSTSRRRTVAARITAPAPSMTAAAMNATR